MPCFRFAAVAAAALGLASYAWAAAPEGLMGSPVQPVRGAGRTMSGKGFAIPSAVPAARFRQVLDRVGPDAASATRGAAQSEIYRRAAPAVVLIVTDDGLGSGALISADGQIVTNYHVVHGAKVIGVVFKPAVEGATPGEKDLKRAKLLKVDEVADLALIQVETVPAAVQPLKLGDLGALQVGGDVQAIGHPHGEIWTYTRGIVSQIRRAYEWTDEDKVAHEATVVQTQTPINPGNSGGPLLDDQGRIVGINSFIATGSEGLNFAVSVEDVKSFLARAKDRVAAAQPSQKDCEIKVISSSHSTEMKGLVQEVDTDCDGESDSTIVTPDRKRDPQMILRDEHNRGQVDTIYYDDNRDGYLDTVLYDTDGDGKPDLMGTYRNHEDEPYRWEKVSG